jgi:hypothetical protein
VDTARWNEQSHDEVETLSPVQAKPVVGQSLSEIEVLDIEERSLLSFQRPVPHRV